MTTYEYLIAMYGNCSGDCSGNKICNIMHTIAALMLLEGKM